MQNSQWLLLLPEALCPFCLERAIAKPMGSAAGCSPAEFISGPSLLLSSALLTARVPFLFSHSQRDEEVQAALDLTICGWRLKSPFSSVSSAPSLAYLRLVVARAAGCFGTSAFAKAIAREQRSNERQEGQPTQRDWRSKAPTCATCSGSGSQAVTQTQRQAQIQRHEKNIITFTHKRTHTLAYCTLLHPSERPNAPFLFQTSMSMAGGRVRTP